MKSSSITKNQSTVVLGPPASNRYVTERSIVVKDTPFFHIFAYLKPFEYTYCTMNIDYSFKYSILPNSIFMNRLYFHFGHVCENSSFGMLHCRHVSTSWNRHFYAVFQIRNVHPSIYGQFDSEMIKIRPNVVDATKSTKWDFRDSHVSFQK